AGTLPGPEADKIAVACTLPTAPFPPSSPVHRTGNRPFEFFKILLPMLEASSNLCTLTILTCLHPPLGITPPRVEIPSLRTLSIGSGYDSRRPRPVALNNITLQNLLASLVLPSLSTFELTCFLSLDITEVWPPSLLDMLKRSLTLQCFLLTPMSQEDLSWEPLSVLLNTIPHITRLHLNTQFSRSLDWCDFIAPLLLELADLSGNIILPHLTHISVTSVGAHNALNTIIALATARSRTCLSQSTVLNHVHPLEELHVEDWESSDIVWEPQMVEAIQNLKRDGMRVLIEKPRR
ncbi:hypothetical protein L218DRAFT_678622, partial [Marasmius fiardii PR-910]